jgi:hypothetical protein
MINPPDTSTINLLFTLLSGTIGVLIGALITSIISLYLFRKQMRIQSNRFFLEKLMQELQTIYISKLSHAEITDESINVITAFQDVSFKDMAVLDQDLNSLKQALLTYNTGRNKTLTSTTTSQEEIHASKMIDNSIKEIMKTIRNLT